MARASLGSLVVSLGLDAADFVSGMNRSEYQARKMAKNIEREMKQVAQAMALVTAAAAGIAAVMVKNAINSADAMTKMSQATGVAVDALSELDYVAKLNGVSTEALGTSMGRLNRNIMDAARGVGDGAKAFQALGINIRNADGTLRNADQVIESVADKFVGMEDGAAKSALAMQLFGRAGAQMIPMLNQGAEGIRRTRDEARALGLTLDTETGKAAEQFNDNLTRLGSANRGLANAMMRELLPTLNLVTDAMVDLAKEFIRSQNEAKAFAGVGDGLATMLAFIGDSAMGVAAVFRSLGGALGALGAMAMVPWGPGWLDQIRAIRKGGEEELDKILSSVSTFRNALERARAMPRVAVPDMPKGAAPVITDEAAIEREQDKFLKFERLREEDAKRQRQVIVELGEHHRKQVEQQMRDEEALRQRDWEGYYKSIEAKEDEDRRRAQDFLKMQREAAEKTNEFWVEAARGMQQAMSGFFFDVMQGNLSDLGSSFKRTVDQMVANALAAKAAVAFFGPDFISGKGSEFGMGGFIGKGISWAKGLFGFATGTDYVPHDMVAVVHRGEKIVPANQNGGGQPVMVTNTFYISGAVDRRSQQQIVAAAGQGVALAMERNG